MYADTAIRQRRVRGAAAIVPRRYSPDWWSGRLRLAAYKHQPHYVVIHDEDGTMREFVALGGLVGANAALDSVLGPEVTTKADLDRLLFASNRRILEQLPDEPSDDLDRFIMAFIEKLARAMTGCGFDAIQAKVKLETIREMSYAQLRAVAETSPDYPDFRNSLAAVCDTES